MTIDEAIKRCEEVAEKNDSEAEVYDLLAKNHNSTYEKLTASKFYTDCAECAADHRQLAEWLKQLEKAKYLIMDVSYTLDVLCDNVSCKVGCKRCTYYDEETGHCEVRKYIDKLRTFAKEVHV